MERLPAKTYRSILRRRNYGRESDRRFLDSVHHKRIAWTLVLE
jgi:hypothetical protein